MTLGFANYQFVDNIAAGKNEFPIVRNIESEKPFVFPIPAKAATGTIQHNSFTKKDAEGNEVTTKGDLTLYIQPSEDVSFMVIKELLKDPKLAFLSDWTTNTVLDNSGKMNLKLKVTKEGFWNFSTNLKSTPQQFVEGEIKKGQTVQAVTTPGFWFNPTEKKYGIYFKLTSLMV